MCAIKLNILKTVGACEWLTFRGTVLTYAAKKSELQTLKSVPGNRITSNKCEQGFRCK